VNTDRRPALRIWHFAALLLFQLILSACKPAEIPLDRMEQNETTESSPPLRVSPPSNTEAGPASTALNVLIPKPVEAVPAEGVFTLQAGANIYVQAGDPDLEAAGHYLAEQLSPATGYSIQVMIAAGTPEPGSIYLDLDARDDELGEEGYLLTISNAGVNISANCPAGVFYGVQTLLQLFPPVIEAAEIHPGPWHIPAAVIRDYPRFEWRGVMLDVARHFFSVEDVKRYIDLAARYKLNRFHIHLSDDQGWRIMIESWPNLARIGGQSAVGGDPGGYYSQADYAEITDYARSRHMVVVPEIDMPGHTNAALNAYPELNCDGTAPPVHTGIEVGFSSLCIQKEITYDFVEDVIRELAEMTPGRYIHIGGDEAQATSTCRLSILYAAHSKNRSSARQAHGGLGRDCPD
jgi:hexosaminidase